MWAATCTAWRGSTSRGWGNEGAAHGPDTGVRAGGDGGLGPSLIDDAWDTGSTDGEIFAVIQKGTGSRMEAWDDRINEAETWNLVNDMRTLVAGKTE